MRGEWYCSAACFAHAVAGQIAAAVVASPRRAAKFSPMPLGLLLVSQGLVDSATLRHALDAQRASGYGRLGSWLQQVGAITERDLTRVLAQQWACPVFAQQQSMTSLTLAIPRELCERGRFLPVYRSERRKAMWIAFTDPAGRANLHSLESMLGYSCDPCTIADTQFARLLEKSKPAPDYHEVVFRSVLDPNEIASVTISYVSEIEPDEVRWAKLGSDLWVRMNSGTRTTDLVFGCGPNELPARSG